MLVVGGGLSGCVAASRLGAAALWEAGDRIGGRLLQLPLADGVSVDIGAQYLTSTPEIVGSEPEHKFWLGEGLLRPLPESEIAGAAAGGVHFAAARGMESLAASLVAGAGVDVTFGRRLAGVERAAAGGWQARDSTGAVHGPFAGIVLALPATDLAAVEGLPAPLPEHTGYSQRYCAGLLCAGPPPGVEWSARYVSAEEDSAVRFLAVDGRKKGVLEMASEPCGVVVHSSVPYAMRALEDGVPEAEVLGDLVARAVALMPGLQVQDARLHCWTISQTRGHGGDAAVELAPGLVLAGDSWAGSGIDNCVRSGAMAAAVLGRRAGL